MDTSIYLLDSPVPDWPFRIVSPGPEGFIKPPRLRRRGYYRVVLDNGEWLLREVHGYDKPMVAYSWISGILESLRHISRSDMGEAWIMLPGWRGFPSTTIYALRDKRTRQLCRDHRCLVPVYGALDDIVEESSWIDEPIYLVYDPAMAWMIEGNVFVMEPEPGELGNLPVDVVGVGYHKTPLKVRKYVESKAGAI